MHVVITLVIGDNIVVLDFDMNGVCIDLIVVSIVIFTIVLLCCCYCGY